MDLEMSLSGVAGLSGCISKTSTWVRCRGEVLTLQKFGFEVFDLSKPRKEFLNACKGCFGSTLSGFGKLRLVA